MNLILGNKKTEFETKHNTQARTRLQMNINKNIL